MNPSPPVPSRPPVAHRSRIKVAALLLALIGPPLSAQTPSEATIPTRQAAAGDANQVQAEEERQRSERRDRYQQNPRAREDEAAAGLVERSGAGWRDAHGGGNETD